MLSRTSKNFAYSFGSLFIIDSNVDLPRVGWSNAHEQQGFSRGPGHIQVGALTQFGIAELVVYVDRFSEKPGFSRVIEIPLEVRTGTVEIFSVDSADSPELIAMDPGHYKVVVAQQLLDENDLDGGKALIEIYFEQTDNFFDKSRIIICDEGLSPPPELLESVQ